jgi:hypothetical protein
MTTPPNDPPALATIDLSGGDETPVAAAGRVLGGVLLMIVGAQFIVFGLLGEMIAHHARAGAAPDRPRDYSIRRVLKHDAD